MHDPWKRLDAAFDAEFLQRRQPDEGQAQPTRCDRTRDMFEEPQQDAERAE